MIKETISSGDWKGEKHVPVIEIADKKEGMVKVEISVGKEIKHPNTLEHHISWVELYFTPEGERFPKMVGRAAFCGHGDMITEPVAAFRFSPGKSGKLHALSFCNIHGLWESDYELKL